jgi:RHS repeat-associated protein
LASENNYRFSTKYADDETGLYYYGYRYYSPPEGRWVNRDPIGEAGGFNPYAFLQNRVLGEIDRQGLFGIELKFSAFIPKSKGRSVIGAPGPAINYEVEPNPISGGLLRWFYGTDDRNVAGWDGSSRVRSVTTSPIDSTKVGHLDEGTTYFGTTAGDSHRIRAVGTSAGLLYAGSYTSKKTHVAFSEQVKNNGCSTEITVIASGNYPFDPLAPNIDYSVTWLLTQTAAGKTQLSISGSRNNFPAYEAIIKGHEPVYEWYPSDSKPGPINLNTSTDFVSKTVELGP